MADKRCALDVNVLLDLAERKKFAVDFLGVIREKYCPLFVSPTAFIELQYLAESGGTVPRKFAGMAIDSLLKWGVYLFDIEPVNGVVPKYLPTGWSKEAGSWKMSIMMV